MSFLWLPALLALVLLPVAFLAYRAWLERGRAESHAWFADLATLERAGRRGSPWRRHGAAWLYGLGLAAALVGVARPQAFVPAPDARAGVMLAIDVSGSMRAEDVKPNRMEAAKSAAQRFVERLPNEVKAGVVSFAGYAVLDSPLTTEHTQLQERIGLLERRRGTAIGEGLRESAGAFPKRDGKADGPAVVILLSDGRNTTGVLPQDAAREAKRLGVKVHTIGVGSASTAPTDAAPFAGFDESELRGIAETTGGRYYAVGSAERLEEVYRELGREIGWRVQRTEVTGLLAALAALGLVASLAVGSFRRLV